MHKPTTRKNKSFKRSSKTTFQQGMAVFIDMSNEAKEEANKLYQKKDYEGAIPKYHKAIKLLPKSHKDIPYLYCNVASCYMKMKPEKYHRAINACNVALKVSPRYTMAMIQRAGCFAASNMVDLAFRDVKLVLDSEPNNTWVLKLSKRIKEFMEANGIEMEEKEIVPALLSSEIIAPDDKSKNEEKEKSEIIKNKSLVKEEENITEVKEEEQQQSKIVKFTYKDDMWTAHIPSNCSFLMKIIHLVEQNISGTKP